MGCRLAESAGKPSPVLSVVSSVPATVVVVPSLLTRWILFRTLKYTLPCGSRAMPNGPSRNADGTPVPAIVLMMPLASILRMRVVSAMYIRSEIHVALRVQGHAQRAVQERGRHPGAGNCTDDAVGIDPADARGLGDVQ